MSRISTYEVVPVPKLADKLIGTSVGGEIEDITYNFTLAELLNLFIPNIPASGLQGVLDIGNSAIQDIILDGTIYTTNLEVTNTATILNSYLNGDTHILGALYDVHNLKGIAAQVLTSTGTSVEWVTLPPIFIPNLQQVLEVGNTADIDIILDANIEALDINVDTATINNNITIDGTITDGDSSVGTLNQVLSSTGTKVKWVNLPSYSAISPLFLDSITGVFSIQQSDNTHNGYLSYVDWITFNGKQPAGNYITALTGEATATGPGSVAISLSNPAVIGKVLSGLSITGGSISATDSILSAFGKVQGQLNALVGGVMFKGVWNASTNNPTLTSSVGTQGWYYIVNVAGNTDLNGITDWQVGDWAIFNGSTWNKIDNTDLVTSVNGQTGAVSLTTDNISEGITNLYYTDTRARNSVSATTPLAYNNISGVFSIQSANSSQNGYLSSTDWSTFNSKQDALSGTGLVKSTTGVISYIADNSSNWDIAYDNSIISAAVTGTSVKTLTLNQQDGGTITATWSDANTGLTSVGLSMPSAFSVSNSPLVSNGTIGVTGAGTASQYIRGDGQLATLPTGGGGGSSVSYYLNGGTSQGTIGGNPYEEMSRTAVVGTNVDFNINTDGYVANFVTDAGDPALLQIPGGNWNFELFFSASSSGGTPSYYVELYKYDGVVLTLIASNSASPEGITGGTSIDLYLTALAVPQTSLTITDRLAVRVYVTHSGRTITLHTQGTHLCQVITTFSTGISALNGLTAQVQYFATGTAGTDFAINSSTATHTFNLPTASATNRGALSTADWTTFNNKADAFSGTTDTVSKFTSSTTIGNSNIKDNGNVVTINTSAGGFGALQVGNYNGSILMNTSNTNGGLIFQNTSSSNKLWDFSSYNNDIHFNESNIGYPVMTLKSGGNVGIKQINPSYQLDVDGTFRNTGVVTLGNLAGSGSRMVVADSSGVLSTQVITTGTVTAVTASSPLASSGGNTPNITIQQSSGSQDGYLSSTDWTTFNNKQASGNYITSLTGEATGTGPGATAVTLNNASVTGKILTGINITGGTVVATDSILTGFGKLQNQVNGLIGGTIYQGTWNANTNTPALTSGVGVKGYYYIVSVAGTTNLDGITDWFVGDWAIFDGTAWQQVDNTDAVVSVNGQTGAVSLTTDNIPEGATNLYFLDSRARAALSFTAGSGAYNSTTGVITIPTNTSQLTNGANFITLASLNGTSPIVYNNTTGNISINQSGTASNGYLSSTDWNTFNGKQNALTNPITGTGTVNYLPKFTGTTAIGNSALQDDGSGTLSYNAISSNNATLALNALTSSSSIVTFSQNGIKYFMVGSDATASFRINSYTGATFNGVALYVPTGTSRVLLGHNVTDNGVSSLQVLGGTYLNGTLQVTGIARFDSTLTNGTYTYTLPSATGTLALTSDLSGYVPTSRTLSINGTTYDLSADRSWTISTNPAARNQQTFTATAGQTTFSIAYTVGQLDVYYNGSKLAPAEFTATNGTSFTLVTACFAGDIVDAIAYITGAGVGGSGTTNYISKFTGSTTLGNSLVYDNGTNVGIGTISPLRKFSVIGIINSQVSDANDIQGLLYAQTTEVGLYSTYGTTGSYVPLTFYTAGTKQMTLSTSGNLGIGTTSPQTLLHIVKSSSPRFDISTTDSYSTAKTLYLTQTGTTGIVEAYNYLGGVGLPLALNPSGGNVLVGTTTDAGYKLDVNGTGRFYTTVSGNVLTVGTTYASGRNIQIGISDGSILPTAAAYINDNTGVGVYIGDNTAATKGLYVKNGGNVGIGTTSPLQTLTLAGTQMMYNTGGDGVANTVIGSITSQVRNYGGGIATSSFASIQFATDPTTWYKGDIRFLTNGSDGTSTGGAERMRITSGGSALVGKTTDDDSNQGIRLAGQFGFMSVVRDGDNTAVFRRNTNNGNIMLFNYAGTTVGSISTNTYSLPSDLNFKKNINTLDLGLNLINKLRPVSYNYKIDDENSSLSTGFIAQELEQSLNELGVKENEYYILQHKEVDDKKQSQYWLDYTKMIPVLTKGIQELSKKLDELSAKNEALIKRIETLENK